MSRNLHVRSLLFFFFNDTATTEIYTLSLHDALPIFALLPGLAPQAAPYHAVPDPELARQRRPCSGMRSEEHTSELQSQSNLVCRLLLEKKKKHTPTPIIRLDHSHYHKSRHSEPPHLH